MPGTVIRLAARHLRVSLPVIISASVVREDGEVQLILRTDGRSPFAVTAFDGRRVRLRTVNVGEGHRVDGRIHHLPHRETDAPGTYRFRFVPGSWHSTFFIFQLDGTTCNVRRILILTMPIPCLFMNATFTERASYGM